MRCVIISGSPETDVNYIKSEIKSGDFVICADKGYFFAKQADIVPDIIVGDFDSFTEEITDNCQVISLNRKKDDTDTLHAIDIALKMGYNNIVLLGTIGGRLDHCLANLFSLQYIHERGGEGHILSEKEYIRLLSVGKYSFSEFLGRTFSIFPFGCDKVCLSYKGAEYPLDKGTLISSFPMGVSNIFVSKPCVIEVHSGYALMIVNLQDTLL